jgi:hypothetical protein
MSASYVLFSVAYREVDGDLEVAVFPPDKYTKRFGLPETTVRGRRQISKARTMVGLPRGGWAWLVEFSGSEGGPLVVCIRFPEGRRLPPEYIWRPFLQVVREEASCRPPLVFALLSIWNRSKVRRSGRRPSRRT